ncbi:MAG: hypothetical protein AAF266_11000 [Planctomycetota bacterium]
MKRYLPLASLTMTAALASSSFGALITQGDVTSNLDGTVFFDDARTGGGDGTVQEGNTSVVNRFFDFDGNGVITAPGVAGTVTIQTFGFATSAAAAANDATQVDLTFIYLGQNENFGGGDDVVIGTERVEYGFSGAGEYFVDLDTDPSAMIDGLGSRFRIEVTPIDIDPGLQETIRFKTRPANEQSFGHQGSVLSVSGTFVAIPEPSTAAAFAMLSVCGLARSVRRR